SVSVVTTGAGVAWYGARVWPGNAGLSSAFSGARLSIGWPSVMTGGGEVKVARPAWSGADGGAPARGGACATRLEGTKTAHAKRRLVRCRLIRILLWMASMGNAP